MEDQYRFTILDKDGAEMPLHYSGRYRTKEEADKLCESLNKGGEYNPYTVKDINQL